MPTGEDATTERAVQPGVLVAARDEDAFAFPALLRPFDRDTMRRILRTQPDKRRQPARPHLFRPGLWASLTAWRARSGTMAIFGAVLLVLEMLWGRASLIVFALSFDGMPDFKGSLLALLDPENLPFIAAYIAVGGLFAGLIFAISVVAMPMILDRQTDAITAGLTSLRLCLTQPGVMLLWGALITLLVALAMALWFAGLLVVAPVLGHASWHAYRAAVAGERLNT